MQTHVRLAHIRTRLRDIKRILVFACNLLGDSICRLPAIKAARDTYPDSRIVVVADPRYAQVFDGQPFVSEVWCLDRRGSALTQAEAWLNVIVRARQLAPDLLLDLYGSARTALVSRLCGAKWRSGLHTAGRSRWYNLKTDCMPQGEQGHIIEQVNSGVRPAGVDAPFTYIPISVTDDDRATAAKALREAGCDPEHMLVLNPSARLAAKRWPAGRFGRLALHIAEENLGQCAVLRAPGEEGLAGEVVRASGGTAVSLPVLTVKELAAVLQVARAIVTGHTGVLHVASAMGASSVLLGGPTDPRLVAYPGCRQIGLFHRGVCQRWEDGDECPVHADCLDPRCMTAITEEEVVDAVRELATREK